MPNATTASRTEATILNRLDYRIEHLENTCGDDYTDAELMSDAADTIAQLTATLKDVYECVGHLFDGIEPALHNCCEVAIALGDDPVPQMDPDVSFPIFQPPAYLPDSRHSSYRVEPEPEIIPTPSPDTLWILVCDDGSETSDEATYTNRDVAETELTRYSSKYPLNTFSLREHPRRSDADLAMLLGELSTRAVDGIPAMTFDENADLAMLLDGVFEGMPATP